MGWFARLFKRKTLGVNDVPAQGWNFSECGPTVAGDVLSKKLGRYISRYDCRNQKPTPNWWTAHDVVHVCNKLGGGGFSLANYTMSREAGIYLSTYAGFGHWVTAWKGGDNLVHVRDPKRGQYLLTPADFRRRLKSTIYVATDVIF